VDAAFKGAGLAGYRADSGGVCGSPTTPRSARAVIAREAIAAGEAAHVDDAPDHDGGDDRADAEDLGEAVPHARTVRAAAG
jgi:hypothetical protein